MPTIDLALNLDGSQEIVGSNRRYPAEYPGLYQVIYGPGRPTYWEHLQGTAIRTFSSSVTKAFMLPPFRWSGTCFLLWKAALRAEELGMHHLVEQLRSRVEEGPSYPEETNPQDDAAKKKVLVDIWERYTLLEFQVARMEHKRVIFFLQPSPTVDPAKPFTPAEEQLGLGENPFLMKLHTDRFRTLQERARELRRKGLQIFDISDVFAETQETVYVDGCCHVNQLGNELIARRIIEALVKLGPALLP
jgi:hypothetical protein